MMVIFFLLWMKIEMLSMIKDYLLFQEIGVLF